ncbi:hypothetical protein KFU94_06200 [Chloroflexi bacterium TSY]|nr:hypothetical protein [Chloroflexi bacterium TSY]
MIIELLAVGGALYAGYAGVKRYQQRAKRNLSPPWIAKQTRRSIRNAQIEVEEAQEIERSVHPAVKEANRSILISSTSLVLAIAGILTQPTLRLMSLPLLFYIFTPRFRLAYQDFRQEQRISPSMLRATRAAACLIMGYLFAAALDAWLEALTNKLLAQSEARFQRSLTKILGQEQPSEWLFVQGVEIDTTRTDIVPGDVISMDAGDTISANGVIVYGMAWLDERLKRGQPEPVLKQVGESVFASTIVLGGQIYIQIEEPINQQLPNQVRHTLQKTVQTQTLIQQAGEQSGKRIAPYTFILFAASLPFRSANQAIAFLSPGFGAQMSALGPHILYNFVDLAARQGIFIKDGRVLEIANLINTIVVDAQALADPPTRVQAKEIFQKLRQRYWPIHDAIPHEFAIYLISDGDEATTQKLAAELGVDDYFVEPLTVAKATLLESLQMGGRFICYVGNGVTDAPVMEKALISIAIQNTEAIETNAAQIILVDRDLGQLDQVFELATQFGNKQGFNILWPLMMDLIDIGTTAFTNLGIVYSLLFSYSGMLVSAINTRLPLIQYENAKELAHVEKALVQKISN